MSHPELAENAYALIFGVSSYVHARPLPSAVRGVAEQLAALLRDPNQGGYAADQVDLFVDGEVTRASVLDSLRSLSGVDTDATVLLYFSGHGGRFEDPEGVFFLPAEADDSSPERLAATAVSSAELATAIEAIPADRMIVFFDCCHSGGLGSVKLPNGLAGSLTADDRGALAGGRGRCVVTSSRADERSWILDHQSASVFGQHLLAALRGEARPRGRWIRAWEVFEYLQTRVVADRPDQHPTLEANLETNFPIASYPGGARTTADDSVYDPCPYHAYLSYSDREPDTNLVWGRLLPKLEAAGLEIAVSGEVEDPGAYRVVGVERGIELARRTVVVLSEQYLADGMARFIDAMAQTLGIEEGVTRLIPVHFGGFERDQLPARLRMLVSLDLGPGPRRERNLGRLIRTLRAPVPALF